MKLDITAGDPGATTHQTCVTVLALLMKRQQRVFGSSGYCRHLRKPILNASEDSQQTWSLNIPSACLEVEDLCYRDVVLPHGVQPPELEMGGPDVAPPRVPQREYPSMDQDSMGRRKVMPGHSLTCENGISEK